MARRRAEAETETETEHEEERGPVRQISATALKKLLSGGRSAKADADEVLGAHRAAIALAVENDNLHKGAFGWIKALDRKEPEALAMWMHHFLRLYEISGLKKRAESAPDLGLGEGDGEGEGDGKTSEPNGSSVRPFPQPHGRAAE